MPSLKSTLLSKYWGGQGAEGASAALVSIAAHSCFWVQIEKHEKKYFQSIGKEKRIKIHTQNRQKTQAHTPEEATRKMLFIH